MDIHQLKVFASVFKNRSFSKASEDIHLTQPTISDHIKALEEELDCKLFDRLNRYIIPTKEAEVLYNHTIELIEKLNDIKTAISKYKKEISGELIIGASTIPGTYLIPSVIAQFQKKYPAISFQIIIADSKEIVGKIAGHEILIGIVGAKLPNNQVNFMPLVEDELIAISSPSLIKDRKVSLDELIKYPMVLREEGSGTRRETERILQDKGIDLTDIKIAGIFGSTDAIKQAVKAGLGISILSRLSVKDELKYGIFKEIKITDIRMKRKFYIVTHKKRTLPAVYDLLLKYIRTSLKNSLTT